MEKMVTRNSGGFVVPALPLVAGEKRECVGIALGMHEWLPVPHHVGGSKHRGSSVGVGAMLWFLSLQHPNSKGKEKNWFGEVFWYIQYINQ